MHQAYFLQQQQQQYHQHQQQQVMKQQHFQSHQQESHQQIQNRKTVTTTTEVMLTAYWNMNKKYVYWIECLLFYSWLKFSIHLHRTEYVEFLSFVYGRDLLRSKTHLKIQIKSNSNLKKLFHFKLCILWTSIPGHILKCDILVFVKWINVLSSQEEML